ncbi:MAG: XVIPCD domain-containing protein [Lysobacteraceae bacterium]
MPNAREISLVRAAISAGIDRPDELAAFMANMTHESLDLQRLEESFRYTKSIDQIKVASAHRRHSPEELDGARLEALSGQPESLARMMYGARMGNDDAGDGYRFRGRGYTQLTGRDNYERVGEALGLDLVNHPERAAIPENAEKIAVHFWKTAVPVEARADIEKSMLAINGGRNGEADRRTRFAEWSTYLTPETIEAIRSGREVPESGQRIVSQQPQAAFADGMFNLGDRGIGVETLQRQLIQAGYTGKGGQPLKPDGDFGPNTKHAVEELQRAHGLEIDGKAGMHSLRALAGELQNGRPAPTGLEVAPSSPSATPGPSGLTPGDTALLHDRLYGAMRDHVHAMDRGMGRIPDEASDRVAAALRAECRANGLTRIDGVVLGQKGSRAEPGEYVFAYSGPADRPHDWVGVKTAEAVQTPVEQSLAKAASLECGRTEPTPSVDRPCRAADEASVRSL